MKLSTITALTTIGLFTVSGLQAATVNALATLDSLTPAGNSVGTDVADLDGMSVGGDGFVLFNSVIEGTNLSNRAWDEAIVDNKPAYVASLNGLGSTSSGGWANYDDVTIGGDTFNTGGIVQSPGDGAEAAMFSIEFGGSVPSDLTLGLLVDNSDSVNWDVTNIRLEAPGGVDADVSITPDGGSDLVRFGVSEIVAGDVFTVYATSPASGALIGGVTFDSEIIPEPNSMFLLLSGACLLVARRRRRISTS